ncbi:MAG: DUF3833 family protein [Marinibacterium sp.]|nr:DUF3833 family protein [Marinibacterium sp.]
MENFIFALLGAGIVIGAVWMRSAFGTFRAQRPQDYQGTSPTFDIRKHLNGVIDCEGVIYGPTGRVTSRFVGEFNAVWQGEVGRMDEHFIYDNGNTQDREWTLRVDRNGQIKATAPDLIGVGDGWQSGSAVQLRYRIKLPESAGGHELDTIDWMYLAPSGAIVNRSQFRKFGLPVGELVATMRPRAATGDDRLAAE